MNSGLKTLGPHEAFTIVTNPPQSQLCGSSPDYDLLDGAIIVPSSGGDPISYNGATREINANSVDETLDNTKKTYTVSASLSDYPQIPAVTAPLEIDYVDPCLNPFDLKPESQTDITDNFSGTAKTFTLNKFTVDPSRCDITYECNSVSKEPQRGGEKVLTCSDINFDGTFNGDPTDGKFTFTATGTEYEAGTLTPGQITVEICGTVTEAELTATNRKRCKNVLITLTDPCNAPVSVTKPGLASPQTYIITDAALEYTHPDFVVDPTFCPLVYTY